MGPCIMTACQLSTSKKPPTESQHHHCVFGVALVDAVTATFRADFEHQVKDNMHVSLNNLEAAAHSCCIVASCVAGGACWMPQGA